MSCPPGPDMLSVLAAACAATPVRHRDETGKRSRVSPPPPRVGGGDEESSQRRKKRPRQAPFPNKLQEIVTANPDVVVWDISSRSLVVRSPKCLTTKVMPQYFNTNGGDGLLKSFTRQLNYYGFHRITNMPNSSSSPPPPPPRRPSLARSVSITLDDDDDDDTSDDEQSPLLLLRLRAGKADAAASDDALLAHLRSVYGDESLVFVNKDKSIATLQDFGRLIRFEKATARVTLDDHPCDAN